LSECRSRKVREPRTKCERDHAGELFQGASSLIVGALAELRIYRRCASDGCPARRHELCGCKGGSKRVCWSTSHDISSSGVSSALIAKRSS
jgi:hypothetical protein